MEDYRKIAIELGQTLISKAPETKEDVERMLPELKESEDERVKKEITELVMQPTWKTEKEFHRRKELCAWLEKQGEHANFRNKIQVGDEVTRNEDGVLVNLSQLNRVAKKDEKQAQKPADKVEPKFHEGDWISGYYTNYKVLSVNNDGYVVEDVDGNKINILFENEKFHHLFTIANAKDGDVVVDKSDGAIGIFQSIGHHPDGGSCIDPSYCFLHCRYDDGFFYADFEDGNTMGSDDVIPATKEQRDLLFQKMRKAGYEWDAEKFELRKIEQKPAENKGMNLVEDEMTPFQKKVFCIIDTAIEEEQGLKQVCDELLALASNEIKQNYVWSEEDETTKNNISHIIRQYDKISKRENQPCWYIGDCLLWMQNIKDRVQPKPKWSEEDEKMIKIVKEMAYTIAQTSDKQFLERHGTNEQELKNWSLSCSPQKQWKPSEEQINNK